MEKLFWLEGYKEKEIKVVINDCKEKESINMFI